MPPRNYQQTQPITTTLRSICESYAPSSCLRELLQNADDARASEVEYVLDSKTYTEGPLLHKALRDYHGPALLVKNNSIFQESDFESLCSIGDSGKQNDIASTGRFGQGFNSVFHWTDMPWVLSGETLLFLDPHHGWSKDIGSPGGPALNIVQDECQEQIRNHLAAFAACKSIEAGQRLDETIIRIPLRTTAQATQSNIKNQATSVDDIKEVLNDFCQEILTGGLLFLKYVRTVTVKLDAELLLKASALQDNEEDARARDTLPSEFLRLYSSNPRGTEQMHRAFKTSIQYENSTETKVEKYLVESLMAQSSGDSDLDAWARRRKLFPWVALAAPLSNHDETFVGTLFSILRLPVQTHQPLHIHGLFAITPDRRGLSDHEYAAQWNRIMFRSLVASAWARLLMHRSTASPQSERFALWPASDIGFDIWAQLDDPVLQDIIKYNFSVWNAAQCCVDFDTALFAPSNSEILTYADALAQIGLSCVCLEQRLFVKVKNAAESIGREFHEMNPKSVRSYLRTQAGRVILPDFSSLLLEYCLLDAVGEDMKKTSVFLDLHGIELFPTLDGKLSAPTNLLLPRDQNEQETFFGARGGETIDLCKLSSTVRGLVLRKIPLLHVAMRHRGLKDLCLDWPILFKLADGSKADKLVHNIWSWILDRYDENRKIPHELHSLWLFTPKTSQVRRLVELHAGLNQKELLEWDQGEIPLPVLLQQLDYCIEHNDRGRVDALLDILKVANVSSLRTKACILGAQGRYLKPDRVFYPAHELRSYPLSPYIDQIDEYFAEKHTELLALLNVRPAPSIEDLRNVQRRLITRDGRLSSEELAISIRSLEVATRLRLKPEHLRSLSIPDVSSMLRDFMDIVHGAGGMSGYIANFNFTHGDVPQSVIECMGVEDACERAMRLGIEFEDKDEDEYTPREDLCTTIDDTLLRYPVQDTWNEFLSNADDAEGTKIIWTLDECTRGPHASEHLLDKKLGPFQGPALFSWNDSIFQEKDFEGFRNIGRGAKGDEPLTTGMFGRGVLSMYHLTCIPQIVSAGFFLILDPQQCCLPFSRSHRKRKVGVKMSLARIRAIAPDQLSAFEGLHGFHQGLDYYDGTIFRFPLRTDHAKTGLQSSALDMSITSVRGLFEEYLETARMSLLFLRNVDSIQFYIRGQGEALWSVAAQRSDNHQGEVFQNISVSTAWGSRLLQEQWRLGITDVMPPKSSMIRTGRGSSKLIECGVAARICYSDEQRSQEISKPLPDESHDIGSLKRCSSKLRQRVFCRLPTLETSQLPISFHGSFNITGDRKTISIEERNEADHWNRWLSGEIAEFYIEFLQNLASWVGERAFESWPRFDVAEGDATLSGYVAELFWRKIFTSKHEQDKLFPLMNNGSSSVPSIQSRKDLRQSRPRKPRIVHKTAHVGDAYFDFLSDGASQTLAPLFSLLELPVVRPPIELGFAHRATSAGVNLLQINALHFTEIFKEEANCVRLEFFLRGLESEERKATALATFYDIIIPRVNSEGQCTLQNLAGCRILARPDLNAPLGLLELSSDSDRQHFEATVDELKLFSFAADHMAITSLYKPEWYKTMDFDKLQSAWHETIYRLSESSLNVRKIRITDIGYLLGLPQSPTRSVCSSELRHKWTVELWRYINSKVDNKVVDSVAESTDTTNVTDVLEDAALLDHAIYRTLGSREPQFLTPREFESMPCIVRPNETSLLEMCSKIPNVICVDPACLPKSLVEDEANLNQFSGFARFLRALEKVVLAKGTSVKGLLEPALVDTSRRYLRKYLKDVLKTLDRAEDVPQPLLIKSLPIWPRTKEPGTRDPTQYMAAEDANFCKHKSMFFKGVKNLHSFVDPMTVSLYEDCLTKLNIHLWTPRELWTWIEKRHPQYLTDDMAVQSYAALIECLQEHNVHNPTPLAPDGNRALRKVEELYDHENAIFEAAFRQEAERRFLHPNAQMTRQYWIPHGLRTVQPSGEISEEDYLESANAVDGQWTANTWNQVFDQQAAGVASYLEFEKRGFTTWSSTTWEILSRVRMFAVKDKISDMRRYRWPRMKQLADKHSHCSLQEAAQDRDRAISWSQLKRLETPPSPGVLALLPQRGRPSLGTVYEHLQFLVGICANIRQEDVSAYVGDLEACYHFLQSKASVASSLPGIQDAQIWLNIDKTDKDTIQRSELLDNLVPTKLICLDAPLASLDDIMMKNRIVKRFLVPFIDLLKGMGCKAVAPSISKAASGPSIQEDAQWLISGLRKQPNEVVFQAEGGERITGHKNFLAAVSEKWHSQLLGPWSSQLKPDAVIKVETDFKTLSTLVKYADTGSYEGRKLRADTPKDDLVDVKVETLKVLSAADEYIMPRLHNKVETYLEENTAVLLQPWSVDDILRRASEANARRLQHICNDYIQRNQHFVQLYRKQKAEEETELEVVEADR